MRKPLTVPVRTAGPGSQPEGEATLDCPQMPMLEPFAMPRVATTHAPASVVGAAAIIDSLHRDLADWRAGRSRRPLPIDVGELPPGEREALNDGLGQGEVSVVLRSATRALRTRIQETAFAGVWRTRHYDADGELRADLLEVADIPSCVRAAAGEEGRGLELGPFPDGAMNSAAVLGELAHHAASWQPGDPPHVVNLSLLPCTREDLQAIDQRLGVGSVAILARGFGACRIGSTAIRNVWRVQYFNNVQTLILDTIEVVDVPSVALAAAEDFEDSLPRLAELVRWMSDDAADRGTDRPGDRTSDRTIDSAIEGSVVQRYECGVCWQIYDPVAGDAVWQVPPGTPFSALPAHWTCPNCGTERTRFMAVADD